MLRIFQEFIMNSMKKLKAPIKLFVISLLISSQSLASATSDRSQLRVEMPVEKFVLENGLTVLLLEDHSVPLVSYHTWYKVGSRNETPGVTGAAHMLEHMMFKGAKKYDGKQFDKILHENGMENNAFTTYDYTGFYQILPSDRLELMMDMEVDRMSSLQIKPEDLKSEIEVVKEERRWRTDNSPTGAVREALMLDLFSGSSYGWPVIGYMKDIEDYTSDKLRFFYDTYYKPNNAVLVIAGDIDSNKVKQLVKKYYGVLKPTGQQAPEFIARAPINKVRENIVKKDVQNATVYISWPSVPAGHPDGYALDIAGTLLGSGTSSRLYKKMVYEQQNAIGVFAYNYSMKFDGMFSIGSSVKSGKNLGSIKKTLMSELNLMRTKLVSNNEIDKATTSIIKGSVDELTTLDGKARALAVNEILTGDYQNFYKDIEKYKSVTAEDVRRVVQKYLRPEIALYVDLTPENSKAKE